MNTNTNPSNMTHTFQGEFPTFPKPILPHWAATARDKGFEIAGRISDRLHIALRCDNCGEVSKSRIFTLMTAQPLCPACIESERREDAAAAKLVYLHRDSDHRHYATYRAPCGHKVRRQTGLIKRIAAGATGLRCEACHAATETAEAESRGWTLIGPDQVGYRLYRHDPCGNVRRIARANMQSGRFVCPTCDQGWSADPSYIYLMRFVLASSRPVIKVGFSRNPESRLDYQLRRDPEMPCEILRKVSMPTGHAAICAEKAMHRTLAKKFPDAIVDPASWHGQIRVKTEIYDDRLTPVVQQMLDNLADDSNT